MPEAPFLSLAPLHGVTGRTFRGAFFAHFAGWDEAVAPFIPATSEASLTEKQFRDLVPREAGGPAIVPQLLGNEAESFVKTANSLADAGYAEVNWNLGCPYPMVANKKRGSGLLPHPELIDSILSSALPRVRVPVSAKIRLGRESARELDALIPVLNRHPLSRVIVHARVGVQMYEGKVDLEGFGRALEGIVHPVAYNGDIAGAAAYRALRDRFPSVGSFMIGRWALADPFIALDIKGLPRPERPLEVLRSFHDELYAAYSEQLQGPRHVLDKMKEIWGFLALSFAESGRVAKRIVRTKGTYEYEEAVRAVFREEPWRPE